MDKVKSLLILSTLRLFIIITKNLNLTTKKGATEHDPEQNPYAWNHQNTFPYDAP
jgi:hypothetical protein